MNVLEKQTLVFFYLSCNVYDLKSVLVLRNGELFIERFTEDDIEKLRTIINKM